MTAPETPPPGAPNAEELRPTLDEVGICFWSLDRATGRITVSPSGARLFGVPPERLAPREVKCTGTRNGAEAVR